MLPGQITRFYGHVFIPVAKWLSFGEYVVQYYVFYRWESVVCVSCECCDMWIVSFGVRFSIFYFHLVSKTLYIWFWYGIWITRNQYRHRSLALRTWQCGSAHVIRTRRVIIRHNCQLARCGWDNRETLFRRYVSDEIYGTFGFSIVVQWSDSTSFHQLDCVMKYLSPNYVTNALSYDTWSRMRMRAIIIINYNNLGSGRFVRCRSKKLSIRFTFQARGYEVIT